MALENQLKIPRDANVLAVCIAGLKRSPTLAEILRQHHYQNVDYVGARQTDSNEVRKKVQWAEYIITLDPFAMDILSKLELIEGRHILIQFDVRELRPGGNLEYKPLSEIQNEITMLISPYLSE